MKKETTRFLAPLSETGLVNLTNEVKEVLAKGYKVNYSRKLSAADLWNIQRQGRARLSRKYI